MNSPQDSKDLTITSEKKFKLFATISSANPTAIKPVLERISNTISLKPIADGFEVTAEFKGESARDLNRMLLSELRRVEKRTRSRSEWTFEGKTEKFFDYALKGTKKIDSK